MRKLALKSALAGMMLCLLGMDVLAQVEAPVPEKLRAAISRVDARAAAEHAKDDVGGLTVGIVAGDRLIWTRSYGYADTEKKIPASAETVYRVGSITKSFTGLMLLQLVQDGKVSLADPVEKYFPELSRIPNRPASASRITLEQLATMTSGLAREPANVSSHSRGTVSEWETLLIAALPDTRFEHAPGNRYLYSNIGYAMLGAALARAASMPYTQYVQQRILTPLNMAHTAFEPTDSMRPRIAKGYELSDTGRVSVELPSRQQDGRGFRVPNGGLYSTVDDLARFVVFELGDGPETVLNRQVLRQTFERLNWDSARHESGYGIGMQIRRQGHLVAFGHDGIVAGYTANVRFDRASKTGVIVLRNVHGGRFDMRGLTYAALAEVARN